MLVHRRVPTVRVETIGIFHLVTRTIRESRILIFFNRVIKRKESTGNENWQEAGALWRTFAFACLNSSLTSLKSFRDLLGLSEFMQTLESMFRKVFMYCVRARDDDPSKRSLNS